MKYFASVLLVCIFAIVLQEISADHLKCSPGKTFKSDCNNCNCSDSGDDTNDAGCTKMACPGYSCTVDARWSCPTEDCECDSEGRSICFPLEE